MNWGLPDSGIPVFNLQSGKVSRIRVFRVYFKPSLNGNFTFQGWGLVLLGVSYGAVHPEGI